MQRLATTLNYLTTAWSRHIAFEAVDTSGIFETWKEEGARHVLLGGRLEIILSRAK